MPQHTAWGGRQTQECFSWCISSHLFHSHIFFLQTNPSGHPQRRGAFAPEQPRFHGISLGFLLPAEVLFILIFYNLQKHL